MPRKVILFRLFQISYYWSKSSEMMRHIAWNLLMPSSSYPSAYYLFNYMPVVALKFVSSAVDIAASNRLWYTSVGLYIPCIRQNMVLITMTAE